MTVRAVALAGLLLLTRHCAAASPEPAAADDAGGEPAGAFWRFYASPLTIHYSSSPDHRAVYSLGVERQYPSGYLFGAAAFRNSFGQPSMYAYAGKRFDAPFASVPQLFFQVSAGVLYGYKEPYEDKVPFNHHGVSPGAVGAVGWEFTHAISAQINVLGDSAFMFQLSFDLR
jgi:hypothetical protein